MGEAEIGTPEAKRAASGASFSLIAFLYWVTLLALGMGTFGPGWGVYFFLVAAGGRFILQCWRGRWQVFPGVDSVVLLIVIGMILLALLMPALGSAREAAQRTMSLVNLKQLALVLYQYHDVHGSFPAPATYDGEGARLHSWRTIILPFLNEQPLYDQIDQTTAWDAEANSKVTSGTDLLVLQSSRVTGFSLPHGETNYFAVAGEETAWPSEGKVSFADIKDGTANTILLIEAAGRGVHWSQPRDLTINEALDLLTGGGEQTFVKHRFLISYRYRGDGLVPRLVVFADGHTEALWPIRDRERARALLTRSGGEKVDEERRFHAERTEPELVETIVNWGNIIPTALFIGLALCPGSKASAVAPGEGT